MLRLLQLTDYSTGKCRVIAVLPDLESISSEPLKCVLARPLSH